MGYAAEGVARCRQGSITHSQLRLLIHSQAVKLFSAYCEERGAVTPDDKLVCGTGKAVHPIVCILQPTQSVRSPSLPVSQRPILLPKAYVGTLLQVWHRVAKHFPRRTYFVCGNAWREYVHSTPTHTRCVPPSPSLAPARMLMARCLDMLQSVYYAVRDHLHPHRHCKITPEILAAAREKLKHNPDVAIAAYELDVYDRNLHRALYVWRQRSRATGTNTGAWHHEELERLMAAVPESADAAKVKWLQVASQVGTRTASQCREKFRLYMQTGKAKAADGGGLEFRSLQPAWTPALNLQLLRAVWADGADSMEQVDWASLHAIPELSSFPVLALRKHLQSLLLPPTAHVRRGFSDRLAELLQQLERQTGQSQLPERDALSAAREAVSAIDRESVELQEPGLPADVAKKLHRSTAKWHAFLNEQYGEAGWRRVVDLLATGKTGSDRPSADAKVAQLAAVAARASAEGQDVYAGMLSKRHAAEQTHASSRPSESSESGAESSSSSSTSSDSNSASDCASDSDAESTSPAGRPSTATAPKSSAETAALLGPPNPGAPLAGTKRKRSRQRAGATVTSVLDSTSGQ